MTLTVVSVTVIFMVVWWFGAGAILLFCNAVAHSETNTLLHNAKLDGKSTTKYRVLQIVHCFFYAFWVVVFLSIPTIVKHILG